MTALIVLVGICASILPIPLGRVLHQAKDLSEPFPCQYCACGCKSAEQCWKQCCCFTTDQKLAWAKKNGVTPPSYAMLKDEKSLVSKQKSTASCSKGCCSKKNTQQDESSTAETVGATKAVLVLSMMAYECSGQSSVFNLLPWAIVETQPDTTQSWELCGRNPSDESFTPIRVFLFPEVPPPRTFG